MTKTLPSFKHAAVLLAGLFSVSACTSVERVFSSKPTEKPIVVADGPKITGAPQEKRLSGRGGTRIALLVNDKAITNNDIRRRANFVKLRRMKGNATSIARKELIDEALQMKEAERLRTVVSQKQVDDAYVRFAQRNKMPVKVLGQILDQRGVTRQGFKQFIKAQMSWQRAVALRVRAEANGTVPGSDTSTGPKWLGGRDTKTENVKEYTIQQVVFTVPKSQRSQQLARRTREAKNFRNRVRGCENGRELAKSLKNVAVLDKGRVRANELPPLWRQDLANTDSGQATRVKQTDKGAEMLIVCRTRDVRQTVTESEELFGDGNIQKAASAVEKKYMAELKEVAVIKER